MHQERLVIFILLQYLTSADKIPCGNQVLQMPKGTIKYNEYFEENITCIWRIIPPKHTITSLKIISFSCDKCRRAFSCCLLISSFQQLHLKLCNQNLEKLTWLSLRQSEIAVILTTCGGSTNLRLDFSTRNETECPNSEFQCLDRSNCFNSSDICGNTFVCNDHSDHLACGGCNEESTRCNNYSDYCFAISERCNDALNCPKGEDEMNCTTLCPQFKCPLEQKCITSEHICDRNIDCMGGFDEKNCFINYTKASKTLIISTMLVISSLCCTLFLCLIVRWVITRRDINRFLENMPEFPLEPFQGPGEEDSEASSSEAEFRSGGEFYEHYLHALKKSNRYSKATQVGGITPKYSHLELDGDNELVVLASLNVPTDMCVGLSLENSLSLTTMKSVRTTNGTCSSSGDDGPTRIGDTKSELHYNSSEKVIDVTRKRNRLKSNTTSHRISFSSSVDEHISKPCHSGTLVLRKSSKSHSCEKITSQGDTSRSLSYFGSGEGVMESNAQQPQSVPGENSNVTKSSCEMKQDGKQMDPNLVSKSGTNLDKFEASTILTKSLSAPLSSSKRYERANRISKSITNVKENTKINTDEIEIDPQSFELPLRSDSSQWTDFEDSLKRSNIILVKTLDEKPKPLKRSCKKKVSYSRK